MSAGLGRPWASWDDAVFWLWMLSLAAGWALAVVAVAGVVWALLLEPGLAWWRGDGLRIVTEAATWRHWLRVALPWCGVLALAFLAFLAWYSDGMLRGSGKAEP